MGVQLSIESEETYAAARELAELTGESMTAAVSRAVLERLERERSAHDVERKMREVRAITADIRKHLRHPLPSLDHSWLYDDETGLPK